MDDLELSRRFRGADPAMTPAESPLTLRALSDLASITAGTFAPRPGRRARRSRGRRLAIAIVATLALVVAIVVVRTVVPSPAQHEAAYAATPPLLATSGPVVPLGTALDAAIRRLASSDLPASPRRQSHYEAWFANISFGSTADVATAAVVSPEDDTFVWNSDLSGTYRSVAGRSWNAANGFEGGETRIDPGTVLSSQTFARGKAGVLFPQTPPTDVAAMRERLISAGWSDTSDPALLVDTIGQMLNEWTLTAAQQTALLEVVRETPGFVSLGSVTDRLGRAGLAFRAPNHANPAMEEILVVSATTGAIIADDSVYLGGLKEFAKVIKAPAVLGYTAWK